MTDTNRAIARILKVNHAGEYGAIRIYKAQRLIAQTLCPDLVPFLTKTLQDEISHCALFHEAMIPRGARPCRAMWLWSWGGYALGLLTALMGRTGIMLCTEAVEDAVHHHMNDQIAFLSGRDDALKTLIEEIRVEELEHLHYAQARIAHTPLTRKGFKAIYAVTEILIWLSTQGGLGRMKHDLA